ncbi:hypothetical protein QR680_007908 [Steinernema hermaphroditum]|uniref:N-acetyltransferase domain-containing protein n=1 Tax=Steinernema hermaphroditum TaxID=289476 RepID=A0AA39IGT7_9BILA|nr:hypothetical protein QR680_007908 [Steinernema hermaphroditum]
MIFRAGNVVARIATPEDTDKLVEFFVKYIGTTSAINKALRFTEEDSRAAYEHKIRDYVPDGLSIVVIDESTKEIVGGCIVAKWTRDGSYIAKVPTTPKARHLCKIFPIVSVKYPIEDNIMCEVEAPFWEMCPKEVNAVGRGECFLLRSDYRRNKIGNNIVKTITSKDFLESRGLQGFTGGATSHANISNMEKIGAIRLVQLSYEEYFKDHGIPLEGAFTDQTKESVMHFVPLKKYDDWKPKVLTKVLRWISSLLSLISCTYILIDSFTTVAKYWNNVNIPIYVATLGHVNAFLTIIGLFLHGFIFLMLILEQRFIKLYFLILVYLAYQLYILSFSAVAVGMILVVVTKHGSVAGALVVSILLCIISILNLFVFALNYRKLRKRSVEERSNRDARLSLDEFNSTASEKSFSISEKY